MVVESLGGEKTVMMFVKMVLLSVGLISIRDSVLAYSCTLLACIRCFLSSPPTIILLLINLMLLLILASSAFRHQQFTTFLDVDHHSPPPPDNIHPSSLLIYPDLKTQPPHESHSKPTPSTSTQEKSKEDDTMEATWKAIISGGAAKKKKKKKMSETWDEPRRLESEEVLPKWKELRKAETFNDAVSVVLIRREPSMSLEEFNQKVEAFINNINNNFRLQRQESHQRFLDNINHTPL